WPRPSPVRAPDARPDPDRRRPHRRPAGRPAGRSHAAVTHEATRARLIHLGDGRTPAPRCETLRARERSDLLDDAIDPAKAQRLVDRVVVGQGFSAARLRVEYEPDLFLARVVPTKPGTPDRARAHVKCFADIHDPRDATGSTSSRTCSVLTNFSLGHGPC